MRWKIHIFDAWDNYWQCTQFKSRNHGCAAMCWLNRCNRFYLNRVSSGTNHCVDKISKLGCPYVLHKKYIKSNLVMGSEEGTPKVLSSSLKNIVNQRITGPL